MTGRHRALPPWMSKKEVKEKQKEPLKSTRKRKTARAVFYCMNERELLEAAVSCLTDAACEDVTLRTDRKVEHKAEDTTTKTNDDPAASKWLTKPLQDDSSDSCDVQQATYVSETDLDITELETMPYTRSPQHQSPEGQRSGPVQTESKVENSKKTAAEEDDALRLVREIFFT